MSTLLGDTSSHQDIDLAPIVRYYPPPTPPPPPTLQESPSKVSPDVPVTSPWGRYLELLSKGYGKHQAIAHSGITGAELVEARRDVHCAQLELACIRVAATGDLSAVTRIIAQSHGPNLVLDAIAESRGLDPATGAPPADQPIPWRDRRGARGQALEVGGFTGGSKQGGMSIRLPGDASMRLYMEIVQGAAKPAPQPAP